MTLLVDSDQQSLMTDPTILITVEGRQQPFVPFRLGMPQPAVRRDGGVIRPIGPQGAQQPVPASLSLTPSNGTPVSVQQQLKKMPPPSAVPQMRISSNGGMRPPPAVPTMQGNPSVAHTSPPPSSAISLQHSPPNTNGINRAAINLPHIDSAKPEVNTSHSILNDVVHMQQPHQLEIAQPHDPKINGSPTKQNQHHIGLPTNGYQLTPLTNQAAVALANTTQYAYPGNQHGLSLQQVQNLKTAFAFANMQNGQDLTTLQNIARSLPTYPHMSGATNFNIQQLTAGSNMNLKLPAARQMQWSAGAPQKGTAINGMDGSVSPNLGQAVPVRTPSANGTHPGMRIGTNGQLTAHSMSPHIQHSPSPTSATLVQSQSPPRPPLTPTMTRASPSLQHQQPGSSKSGY